MYPGGIRTHNPSKRAAADPALDGGSTGNSTPNNTTSYQVIIKPFHEYIKFMALSSSI